VKPKTTTNTAARFAGPQTNVPGRGNSARTRCRNRNSAGHPTAYGTANPSSVQTVLYEPTCIIVAAAERSGATVTPCRSVRRHDRWPGTSPEMETSDRPPSPAATRTGMRTCAGPPVSRLRTGGSAANPSAAQEATRTSAPAGSGAYGVTPFTPRAEPTVFMQSPPLRLAIRPLSF